MTLGYRDLPAIPFAVASARRFARPAGARWSGLSIGPDGEVFMSHFAEGVGSTVLGVNGDPINLKLPNSTTFVAGHLQRFVDGRWLVVDSRTEDFEPNAHIFTPDGTFSHAFYAGDGIETVLIDAADRIWIGYYDEGVFGAGDYPPGHAAREFGPNVLVRLDDHGQMEFAFNYAARGRKIWAIYALTSDDDNRIWLSALSERVFAPALASVDGQAIEFTLDRAPDGGAAISVASDHFVFFGGSDHPCMVTIVERASRRLRLIQLRDSDDRPLSPALVATRGGMAVALHDDALYRLDLELLLDALGPWHEGNSSTVDFAVRYMDEEASYAPRSVLTRSTGAVADDRSTPRPPGNAPRDDDCGGARLRGDD